MSKNNISGIYAIRNKINGKVYVGSSKSVHYRWGQSHRPFLRKGDHPNDHLQHSWSKYGEDNFEFEVIEECDESLLAEREEHWIEHHKSWNRQFGYNLNRIVEGRVVVSEETRRKMKISSWQNELPYEEFEKQVLDLFVNGVSKNKIATRLNSTRDAVYTCLEEHDLHVNEGKGSIIKLTPDVKKGILALREQGLAWEEILQRTGISRTQLYRTMDIKDGGYGGDSKNRTAYRTITEEVKQKAVELRQQGKSWKDIAAELGVDRTALYRHKLNVGREGAVRVSMTPELKEKILELRGLGRTWVEISEKTGISKGTIYLHGLHKI